MNRKFPDGNTIWISFLGILIFLGFSISYVRVLLYFTNLIYFSLGLFILASVLIIYLKVFKNKSSFAERRFKFLKVFSLLCYLASFALATVYFLQKA